MDKDIKYTFSTEITITPEGVMLGVLSVHHENVTASMSITKTLPQIFLPLGTGPNPRIAAMDMSNKLLRLAGNFIASAVVQEEYGQWVQNPSTLSAIIEAHKEKHDSSGSIETPTTDNTHNS